MVRQRDGEAGWCLDAKGGVGLGGAEVVLDKRGDGREEGSRGLLQRGAGVSGCFCGVVSVEWGFIGGFVRGGGQYQLSSRAGLVKCDDPGADGGDDGRGAGEGEPFGVEGGGGGDGVGPDGDGGAVVGGGDVVVEGRGGGGRGGWGGGWGGGGRQGGESCGGLAVGVKRSEGEGATLDEGVEVCGGRGEDQYAARVGDFHFAGRG